MDTVDDCELNIGHLSVTELTPAVSRQCCITTSNDQLGLKKKAYRLYEWRWGAGL